MPSLLIGKFNSVLFFVGGWGGGGGACVHFNTLLANVQSFKLDLVI